MRIPMVQTRVLIEFVDGTSFDTHLYMSATGRIQDILNDERLFIPVDVKGRIELVNKNQIRRVLPHDDD